MRLTFEELYTTINRTARRAFKMSEAMAKYEYWLEHAKDEQVAGQLALMEGDASAIENAFYKDLEFGTAGLRGIMAAGSNCMNVYTVLKATKGVASYMLANKMTTAAITYDSRLNSELFARTSAAVLAESGIRVYITDECMPTPYVSFMIRRLHCSIGINVTASHNPAEYNGYKVYNCQGCQIGGEEAREILSYMDKINPFEGQMPSFDEYVQDGTISYTDKELEEKYKQTVLKESQDSAAGIKAVYTPLNGAGYRIVPEVLKRAGLTSVEVVSEQAYPDGTFATCPYPNPEKPEAMRLAVSLAKKTGADIVIGNDPDCDRLGVAVKDGNSYKILSGNEVGVLLCDYVLSSRRERGTLPLNPVVVKTIVSTIMADKIAAEYGAEVRDVLTGFKYIGEVISVLEQDGEENRFVFGFEESCGYLKGTYVRDKDGVLASMLVAEAAAKCKRYGMSLADKLRALYEKYGNYFQQTVSYRFEGAEGAERKDKLLEKLRKQPFERLGTSGTTAVRDYLVTDGTLPKADVLRFNAQDGSQLIIRPSGTEPLIKAYITVSGDECGNAARFAAIKKQTDEFFA